jgi:type IV pilus assembly protein PilX
MSDKNTLLTINGQMMSIKQQSGVVMAVSLILLLALTIIAVTGTEVTGLEQKMAANGKNTSIAFQSADTALRAAEQAIDLGTTTSASFSSTNPGTGGFYQTQAVCKANCPQSDATCNSNCTTNTSPSYFSNFNWSTGTTATYSGYGLSGVYQAPQFIIEQLATTTTMGTGDCMEAGCMASQGNTESWYRITARAVGSDANAVVILQSIYKK